jgi:murein DD-endopeptidase MepM/ murein hydrolase activator NlpD
VSRSSAPQVLERPGIEREPAWDDVVDDIDHVEVATPSPAEPTPPGRTVTRGVTLSVPGLPSGHPLNRLLAGRRLPQPPGRRAPMWFAALVAGALLAMLPSLVGSPVVTATDASDYGLGAGSDVSLGGLDDAGVRRSITEAEAQARLSELAASRAAREPKTVVPVGDYRLTTCFCMRWGQMHPGWDMAAPLGTPIYSATDGVVLKAGRESGYGNVVLIQDTDGNVHLYGHMRYYDVEAGQIVSAGDQIAKIGNEGFSTGPHLHWQIHRGGMDGRPMDPQDWLAERGI